MLIGARAAGFAVKGNVEWRKYYHAQDDIGRNTFTENFPGAHFHYNMDSMSMDDIERFMGADIALGHPECGRFSQLDGTNRKAARDKGLPERHLDPADIPLFVDIVAKLKPRFFVMDDLPKSFEAFPMSEYAKRLPEYDLFPEWISNWGYGNVQRGRNRMFMLGSLRAERWAFVPGERVHTDTVATAIGDLSKPSRGSNIPNHDPIALGEECYRALNLNGYGNRHTWRQVKDYFKDKPGGYIARYPNKEGREVLRIGWVKGHWDGPAHVLTGNNPTMHFHRLEPYTIRERARIQGFPDDFTFYGTPLNAKGEWDPDSTMTRQTGKAMPIQFCQYVSTQVMAHIQKKPFETSNARVIDSNAYVDSAKQWYCSTGPGYADQKKACNSCWLYDRCSIRSEKYNVEDSLLVIPRHGVVRGDHDSGDAGGPRQAARESKRAASAPGGAGARAQRSSQRVSRPAARGGPAPKARDVSF